MNVKQIIEHAKKAHRKNLTEAESKQLLKHYDIPVVEEVIARNTEEAVLCAQRIGFPVVLKALGTKLLHKTEKGLVKLPLQDQDEVKVAALQITEAAGNDLEGFLIQPFLKGKREFVAGLFNDDQFGPVIMFGLGGIFTEALEDVAFRVAPLKETEAEEMLDGLHASKLLHAFRGEAPAQRQSLISTLTGLSRLAMENPEIAEVDINPLIVEADGQVTAVDALVVFGTKRKKAAIRKPVDVKDINAMFFPKSIVFIGASASFGKWGYSLFTNVVAGNYEGKIYLVNDKGKEISGRPVYKSILDIPDNIELAIVTIPAKLVLDLIPKFQTKGIKHVLLISSGFSETGEEGRLLEEELVKKAVEAGIVILGPNTMGICNPKHHFYCMGAHVRPKPGTTSLVAQSGNLGTQLLGFAEKEDVGIRAFCGSGNEAMVTIEDYLDCLEVDSSTKTAVLYVESIKDGRRFFETTRRVGHKKPVIVLKGGRTEAGNLAAASHTGAMASNMKIFNAACRQAGAILAEQPMDILDLSAAFSSLPLPKGNKVAIVTLGGGWGVVATDLCIENGLVIPKLTPEIIEKIDRLLPPYWSHSNPIDIVGEMDNTIPTMVLEELIKWQGCDAIIHLGIVGRMLFINNNISSALTTDKKLDPAALQQIAQFMLDGENNFINYAVHLIDKYKKPIIGVGLLPDENTRTITEVENAFFKSVIFQTPERAVRALASMSKYQFWLQREGVRKE